MVIVMKLPFLLGALLRMRPHTNHAPPNAGFLLSGYPRQCGSPGQRDRAAQPDGGLTVWPWGVDWVGPVLMAHRNGVADPNSVQLRTPQLVRVP